MNNLLSSGSVVTVSVSVAVLLAVLVSLAPIGLKLDTDRPVRVVELGLVGGGEIPVADNVEVGRDRVEDGTPLPLEIEPGGRPNFPVAAQQPFALEQRQR